jgi:hypothetical protein
MELMCAAKSSVKFRCKDKGVARAILKGIQEYVEGHHGEIIKCESSYFDAPKSNDDPQPDQKDDSGSSVLADARSVFIDAVLAVFDDLGAASAWIEENFGKSDIEFNLAEYSKATAALIAMRNKC